VGSVSAAAVAAVAAATSAAVCRVFVWHTAKKRPKFCVIRSNNYPKHTQNPLNFVPNSFIPVFNQAKPQKKIP